MPTTGHLAKKATILFSTDFYRKLTALAHQRNISVGELVRDACQAQYFRSNSADRRAAVEELARLALPVSTPEEMKRESVPVIEPLP